MLELVVQGREGGFDIAQTFPVSQLRKGHRPELFGPRQGAYPAVTIVTVDHAGEGRPWQEVQKLSKQGIADVHGDLPGKSRKVAAKPRSNRHHVFLPWKPRESWQIELSPLS